MHNFFVRLKSQFNAFATTSTIPASPATPNAIVKEERASSLPYDVTGRIIKQRRHNSAPDMELQRTRSLKAIRVRKVSKGSLKSVRRGTVCVTVSTHASSVFYNTEIEVIVAAICCKRLTDTVIRDSVLILKFFICWGDYIKHPVLYELSHKYGFTDNLPESALPDRLEEIKEAIRREIRKELKIKEGAEKLREVAKDRRSLNDVATIVKKSNSKIAELKSELQELESQILLTQGNTAVTNNGRDILLPNALSQGSLGSNSQSSDRNNGGSGDGLISGGHEQLSANDKLMLSLEKQLNIEMKVKNGAENMIQSLQSGHYGRDKKLLAEAQQMLTDSKAKIEFLRLRILKVKQNKEHANKLAAQIVANAEENGGSGVGGVGGLMPQRLETSLEERIEELRHRLRIEAAVVDGAKNVIRILQNNKVPDKKALQEVSVT
uniref:REM-1 domain-containing protein n=1 Tax=Glossina palpalis gambiensis TaxID=67801 RepID=A0A1B0C2I5_9MUSC